MEYKAKPELNELNRLYQKQDELYHETAMKLGISDNAYMILYAIVELGEGCLQRDISSAFFTSKQTVNSSVQSLVKKGYLRLEKGKRRDMHLHFTPEGERFVTGNILPFIEAENKVFDEIPPEEKKEFLRLLKKYIYLYEEKIRPLLDTDNKEK